MTEVMMRQLVLVSEDTGARLVTWVDNKPGLKHGAKITLKDNGNDKELWKVVGWDDTLTPREGFVDSHNALKTFKSVEGRQTKKDLRTN